MALADSRATYAALKRYRPDDDPDVVAAKARLDADQQDRLQERIQRLVSHA